MVGEARAPGGDAVAWGEAPVFGISCESLSASRPARRPASPEKL
ncbi:MAG: hypothetical protein QOG92_2501, partial [Verrucomicrobiota bacterium]|nr:hypothetical protein [Verrucomicrobiota bacterium]